MPSFGSAAPLADRAARVRSWLLDGWDVQAGRSAIAEVYPRMWSGSFAREDRTVDQHDAYSVARGLSRADHDGAPSRGS